MKSPKQIIGKANRAVLREYLLRRLWTVRSELRGTIDAEEISHASGAEIEVLFAFDELLGEEAPDKDERVPVCPRCGEIDCKAARDWGAYCPSDDLPSAKV